MSDCLTLGGTLRQSGLRARLRPPRPRRASSAARAQVAALIGAAPRGDRLHLRRHRVQQSRHARRGGAPAPTAAGTSSPCAPSTRRCSIRAAISSAQGCTVTYLTPEPQRAARAARRSPRRCAPTRCWSRSCTRTTRPACVQDIAALGALCRERGVLFHCDACAGGRQACRSTCARCRSTCCRSPRTSSTDPRASARCTCARGARPALQPLSFGGGQERGLRPGTLPMHQIAGFGAACELARQRARPAEADAPGRAARAPVGGPCGPGRRAPERADAPRVPGILNVSFEGSRARACSARWPGLARLDRVGVQFRAARALLRAARAGARCPPRRELAALQPGRFTTAAEVDRAPSPSVRHEVRAAARACSPAAGACGRGMRRACGAGERASPGRPAARAQGTWVRFQLRADGDTVKEARFSPSPAPILWIRRAWLCEQLRGPLARDLIPGDPARLGAGARACRSRNWGGCWWSKMHCVPASRTGT